MRILAVLLAAMVGAIILPSPVVPAGGAEAADGRAAARDGRVRVHAVAWRHDVERVDSYDTFRAAVFDHARADIVPQLATDRPNLVTYPEDQGLMAYFIGARGVAARELLAGGAGAPAVASLAGPYAPQVAYYAAKYPGIDSPGQLLLLALTDTSVRAIVEVFADLAIELGVYVTVSTNVADFERVTGPAAALLGDPEAATDYAYEATSAEVRNVNFFLSPEGELVDVHKKAYLVPLERTRDVGLGMTGIEVDELRTVDLPFARVGTVISKDAWMPDVNERFDQLGATLLVQPEAFSTWAVPDGDLWPPDKFQRSGWLMTQRHPALRANVTPMLTGNFGDVTFDGQPLVAVESPGGLPDGCLMGQEPEPGWAAVGRWSTLADPFSELCGEQRRPELADRGERMLPGSGDPLENAYAEDVVVADLDLSAPLPRHPRVPSGGFEALSPAPGDASQLAPHVAPTAGGALLTWVDYRRGRNQSVYAATSADGISWSEPHLVSDRPVRDHDHFDNQFSPVSVQVGDGLVAAFIDFRVESWDVHRSISPDGGETWSANDRVDDADRVDGTIRERGHASPALVATADGGVLAAWSDLRWPFVHPQVRVARSDDGGLTFGAATRVDGGPVSGDDEQLDGRSPGESEVQSAPALAVTGDGTIVVVWQDQAGGTPHIRLARSADGGATFDTPVPLTGGLPAFRPSVAADGETVWLAYEQRRSEGGTAVLLARSDDGGRTFATAQPVDPASGVGVTQRHATALALPAGAAVVYADDRAGDEDVLITWVGGDGRTTTQRVDDGSPGEEARAPTATLLAGGRVLVVWQDTRGGVEALRAAVTPDPAPSTPSSPQPPGAPTPPVEPARLPATGAPLWVGLVLLVLAGAGTAVHRRG
jgi:predicted amidohydrolase